ncbi:hypothetical protein [Paenibacillus sp. GCM10028914]|uniref:hypothetical protein n=1 Tax=Paenibacillus sp. GCM10028914 TaxID=3273416 RepID=UPI00361D2BEC
MLYLGRSYSWTWFLWSSKLNNEHLLLIEQTFDENVEEYLQAIDPSTMKFTIAI